MITLPTLIITFVLCCFILAVSRQRILSVFVVAMCFVPSDQAVVLAGLDFKVLRILALVALARMHFRGEKQNISLVFIDKLLIYWCFSAAIIFVLHRAELSRIIFQLGRIVDIFFIYYVFRTYTKSLEDIHTIVVTALVCSLIMVPFIAFEITYRENLFAILGTDEVNIRAGEARAAGTFDHPIHLGSFAASFLPLAFVLASKKVTTSKSHRRFYWASGAGLIFLLVACNSSGPILAAFAAIFLMALYKYRAKMGRYTYLLLLALFCLHLAMNKPIWHLMARIDLAGGSTGFHRYNLINQTIINFREWALTGVDSVEHWGVWWGDVTNMYILEGVRGGFLTFLLFSILVFIMCRIFWKGSLKQDSPEANRLVWGLFCAAVSHAVSFISIAYFGQILMLLLLWIAAAAAVDGIGEVKAPAMKQRRR